MSDNKITNYNRSKIYMIYCEDEGVDEFYVGSSANLKSRTATHKSSCNNINDKHYNVKLYRYIRDNFGWDNFTVKTLEKYSCENEKQLHNREQKWIEELKPTLNCKRAISTIETNKQNRQKFYNVQVKCNNCDIYYSKSNKARHLQSKYCINYKSNQNV